MKTKKSKEICLHLFHDKKLWHPELTPSLSFCGLACLKKIVLVGEKWFPRSLCLILLKLHILACLINNLPTAYCLCRCIEIKLSVPLEAHGLRLLIERFSSAVMFLSYVLSSWNWIAFDVLNVLSRRLMWQAKPSSKSFCSSKSS